MFKRLYHFLFDPFETVAMAEVFYTPAIDSRYFGGEQPATLLFQRSRKGTRRALQRIPQFSRMGLLEIAAHVSEQWVYFDVLPKDARRVVKP